MRRKTNLTGFLLIVAGLVVAVAYSQPALKHIEQTCPTCPGGVCPSCPGGVCPNCPGGVCPKPYQELERYYTSLAQPAVDIPPAWRESNYAGGSCVHATTESLLRRAGLFQLADWWRQTYSGGDNPDGLEHKLKAANLKFVQTTDGDEQLLQWAVATRRGAGIGWPTAHCTALIDICDGHAVILDNNHTDRYTYIPWDQFVREWKSQGGWGFALVYNPPPPTPTH